MKRAIVVVLDGCGAGEAPDAALFGDHDHPSTLRNTWEASGGFDAPRLAACGLLAAGGVPAAPAPWARYGRLREISAGKDSVTGHWEMMGAITREPFPTYPSGFPIPLVKAFEQAIGTQTIGNKAASGTAIIAELGPLHVETGFPILYTSADSVLQVACHEEVVPIERLYAMCQQARALCSPPHHVQRVIARPFVGDAASGFTRTERRRDFPLPAPENLVDRIGDVLGIGVVPELFDGRGFRPSPRTQSNAQHAEALWRALDSDARFIFANFEDFDMLFGHRNDPLGFAQCLEAFDGVLAVLERRLGPEDLLILTADHGNDPTTPSTDHSREYVPVALVGSGVSPGTLGDVDGMSAVGATVAAWLGIDWTEGTDLLA
jgi:phosphopentomutase